MCESAPPAIGGGKLTLPLLVPRGGRAGQIFHAQFGADRRRGDAGGVLGGLIVAKGLEEFGQRILFQTGHAARASQLVPQYLVPLFTADFELILRDLQNLRDARLQTLGGDDEKTVTELEWLVEV